ncbi:MAG: GDP-mannose 4,6-dehydratase [Patescibacteria group bacterium]
MSNIKTKNIIVAGGAGFIGSNLCEELVKRGNNVLCIDNFSTGSQKNIDHLLQSTNFEFINHDLTKPINLEDYREAKKFKIEFYGVSEIYHLACPTSSKDSSKLAFDTVFANSHSTKTLLDIAEKYNSKVFFASSSSVYGAPTEGEYLINEKYIGRMDNLSESASYDEGKRFAETICYVYNKYKNIDIKIARVFPTYGPRMRLDSGVFIADAIIKAVNNEDIVVEYSKDEHASFCYVKDLVESMILIMENGKFGPYNIGNPEAIKISEVIDTVKKIVSSTSLVEYQDNGKKKIIPNIDLVKEKFGWFPLTLLEEALRDTIDYMKAAKNSFNASDMFKEGEEDVVKTSKDNLKKNKNSIFGMIFKE